MASFFLTLGDASMAWLGWVRWVLSNPNITHGFSVRGREREENTPRGFEVAFRIGIGFVGRMVAIGWTSLCGMGLSSCSVFTGIILHKGGNNLKICYFSPPPEGEMFTDSCTCPFKRHQSTPEPTLHNLENPRKSTPWSMETFPWELFLYSC